MPSKVTVPWSDQCHDLCDTATSRLGPKLVTHYEKQVLYLSREAFLVNARMK